MFIYFLILIACLAGIGLGVHLAYRVADNGGVKESLKMADKKTNPDTSSEKNMNAASSSLSVEDSENVDTHNPDTDIENDESQGQKNNKWRWPNAKWRRKETDASPCLAQRMYDHSQSSLLRDGCENDWDYQRQVTQAMCDQSQYVDSVFQ